MWLAVVIRVSFCLCITRSGHVGLHSYLFVHPYVLQHQQKCQLFCMCACFLQSSFLLYICNLSADKFGKAAVGNASGKEMSCVQV